MNVTATASLPAGAGFRDHDERIRYFVKGAPTQNFGDYLIPAMTLRPELGEPEARGFALHVDATTAE